MRKYLLAWEEQRGTEREGRERRRSRGRIEKKKQKNDKICNILLPWGEREKKKKFT